MFREGLALSADQEGAFFEVVADELVEFQAEVDMFKVGRFGCDEFAPLLVGKFALMQIGHSKCCGFHAGTKERESRSEGEKFMASSENHGLGR